MEASELRRACELADLKVSYGGLVTIGEGVHAYTSSLQNPMLPAYVASLLVAKIDSLDWFEVELRPTNADEDEWEAALFAPFRCVAGVPHVSTIEEGPFTAIIRAAVAALEATNTEAGR
jgi:hypothetical protein